MTTDNLALKQVRLWRDNKTEQEFTLTVAEIARQFVDSELYERDQPFERRFGIFLMDELRGTAQNVPELIDDVWAYLQSHATPRLPLTLAELRRLKDLYPMAELCRRAGLKRGTIASKLSRGTQLTRDESEALAGARDELVAELKGT